MKLSQIASQTSAGLIVGLSAIIYSLSYGALLFSGQLVAHVSLGITAALITSMIGALLGMASEDGRLISGPDTNTISGMVGALAVVGSLELSSADQVSMAMETIFLSTVVCAGSFFLLARFKLAGLVRYIPFSVMAGLLASTGWLMCSGALTIIAGTPLNLAGLDNFLAQPYRPELALGIAVAASLRLLASRVPHVWLIPLVMALTTAVVNLMLVSGLCGNACDRNIWLFSELKGMQWVPAWKLDFSANHLGPLLHVLPYLLAVSFIGLLTILLTLSSLELTLRREFDLNRAVRTHGAFAAMAALLGGFVGIIATGRTTLNQATGGGALSGLVAALACLAVLLGAGSVLIWVPKAALGGLVLYLGVNMLLQWLWGQRRLVSKIELAQIVLILVLVAHYGYLAGFGAGLAIACLSFVVTYSALSVARPPTDLSLRSSSVVRPPHHTELLKVAGHKSVIYQLNGYFFFGSANRIDQMFKDGNIERCSGVVVDFRGVSGIDRAAIGVFSRILRRYESQPLRFYFVVAGANRMALDGMSLGGRGDPNLRFFVSFDEALEAAEEDLISSFPEEKSAHSLFEFLDSPAERQLFLAHCESRSVAQGEKLCAEGDLSDAIYFVERGSFDITKATREGPIRLSQLREGTMAGEMAFYTGQARTATIEAVQDSEVKVLSRQSLEHMRDTQPGLASKVDRMVIRKLCAALVRSNALMASQA
jgi:SulP family sulfate permease